MRIISHFQFGVTLIDKNPMTYVIILGELGLLWGDLVEIKLKEDETKMGLSDRDQYNIDKMIN